MDRFRFVSGVYDDAFIGISQAGLIQENAIDLKVNHVGLGSGLKDKANML